MFQGKKWVFLGAVVVALGAGRVSAQTAPFRVLSVDQSGAYLHATAVTALGSYLQTLSTQKGFTLVRTSSAANAQSKMNIDTLRTYQIVIWNNNTSIGGVITTSYRAAFQQWLKEGGGLVAWHGVMDHADLWPWMTDSVLGGTRFTQHSPWNSTAGRNAKVRIDTIPTNGVVRSQKPEYQYIVAGSPKGQWTYPDEWYSFTINPRAKVDMLMTIDEATFDEAEVMGADHPVAWAYKLPAAANGRSGRFIYHARGHDTPAFTGTGTNAAPNDTAGRPNSPTSNFVWQSICWAYGARVDSLGTAVANYPASCPQYSGATAIKSVSTQGTVGFLDARSQNGSLKVAVTGSGRHVVELFTVSGQKVALQTGEGDKEYSFSNLRNAAVYIVQVKSGKQTLTRRVIM